MKNILFVVRLFNVYENLKCYISLVFSMTLQKVVAETMQNWAQKMPSFSQKCITLMIMTLVVFLG